MKRTFFISFYNSTEVEAETEEEARRLADKEIFPEARGKAPRMDWICEVKETDR